jgi:hypothetical protein
MTTGRRTPIAPLLTIVGGAIAVIGSFLTWFSLSGLLEGSAKGIDASDGWITFTAGLIAAAAGLAALARGGRRALGVLAILGGLAAGGVGVLDATTIRDQLADEISEQTGASADDVRVQIDQAVDAGQLEVTIGIGLYLVIAGGAVALVGGLMQVARGPGAAGAPAMPASAPPMAAPPYMPTASPPPTPPAPAPPPGTPPS